MFSYKPIGTPRARFDELAQRFSVLSRFTRNRVSLLSGQIMPPAPPVNRWCQAARAPAGNDPKRIAQGVGWPATGNVTATSRHRLACVAAVVQSGRPSLFATSATPLSFHDSPSVSYIFPSWEFCISTLIVSWLTPRYSESWPATVTVVSQPPMPRRLASPTTTHKLDGLLKSHDRVEASRRSCTVWSHHHIPSGDSQPDRSR